MPRLFKSSKNRNEPPRRKVAKKKNHRFTQQGGPQPEFPSRHRLENPLWKMKRSWGDEGKGGKEKNDFACLYINLKEKN
jgi:hypothetical protein